MTRRPALLACYALFLLQLADLASTRILLHRPGVIEANPLAAIGLHGGVIDVAKLTIPLAMMAVVARAKPSTSALAGLWACVGLYVGVVGSNLLILARVG